MYLRCASIWVSNRTLKFAQWFTKIDNRRLTKVFAWFSVTRASFVVSFFAAGWIMSDTASGSSSHNTTTGIEIPGTRNGYRETDRGVSSDGPESGGLATPPNTPLSTSLNPNNSSMLSKSWFAEQFHRYDRPYLFHSFTVSITGKLLSVVMLTCWPSGYLHRSCKVLNLNGKLCFVFI